METNNETKQAARNLFLHTDKTRVEIADIVNVNTKTLYLWIKNGKWEEMKTAARQTPTNILQNFHDHIEAVNNKIKSREDKCPTMQDVEMLRKLMVSIKHLQKMGIATYIEVFQELTSFINMKDHGLAVQVVNIADEYIRGKLTMQKLRNHEKVSEVCQNLREEAEEQKAQEEKQTHKEPSTAPEPAFDEYFDLDKNTDQLTSQQKQAILRNVAIPEDCTFWDREEQQPVESITLHAGSFS